MAKREGMLRDCPVCGKRHYNSVAGNNCLFRYYSEKPKKAKTTKRKK